MPPNMRVAPPIAAPRAAPGPPPAAPPIADPEAAPNTPPPRPRWTGSYGFVQAARPNASAAMTKDGNRGMMAFPEAVDLFEPTTTTPFLSTNPAVGLENLSGRAWTWRFRHPIRDGMAHQRASELVKDLRISHLTGLYFRRELSEPWKRAPSNGSSPRSPQPMLTKAPRAHAESLTEALVES